MYNFFDGLTSYGDFNVLLEDFDFNFEKSTIEVDAFAIDGDAGGIGNTVSFSSQAFESEAEIPVEDIAVAQMFDNAAMQQLLENGLVELDGGDSTSCCPCVACSGQNEEADFVGIASYHEGHTHFAPDFSTLIGSEGYDIPSLDSTASNLTFTLNDTGGVGAGSQAEAGFLAAAALWSSFFTDDIDIRLDVGFSALAPGVLGSAGSQRVVIAYEDYRDALIADGTSPDDATAIANLELGTTLEFGTQDSTGTFILDDDGSVNNTFLAINVATALAIGLTTDANGNAIDDGTTAFANITFNSNFTFDFDPTDGVDAGAIDFVGVAFHEIGHALGFTSGVDVVDTNPTLDLNGFAIFNQLDIFRYSDRSQDAFGTGTRDLGYGGDTFFSIDGGETNLGLFSTGRNNGDGQQASHWKDGLGLGILDPTSAPAGQANVITELDLRAFDVIGFDRVGETATPPTDLTGNDDNFTGTNDDENINGLAGDDIIDAAGGNDFIFGGAGNDTLLGNTGNDVLFGETGDDFLIGGEGADSLSGGDGFDTVDYRGAVAGVALDADGRGTGGEADGDSFDSIERFYLSDFDDVVTGSDVDEIFFGEDGNDFIAGGEGNDSISGSDGNDVLWGEIGDDLLFGGAGNDELRGGNDTPITGPIFGDGQITRDAGAGNDSIANALNIDDDYSLDADPNILNDISFPHVTVSATGDGTVHFYAFTVYGPDSNVTLDIDFGDTGGAGSFNSFLELFDAAGNLIASNDLFPFTGGAGGSTSSDDALISLLIANPGVYFVAVSESGGGGVPSGATYELNVSSEDNAITDPDSGNDTLDGGAGDDLLFGGLGTDSAQFSGVQANYTVIDNMDGTYTVTDNVGTDGTDTLESIEFLIFSDVTVDIETAVTAGSGEINGTSGDDNPLSGTEFADTINGLAGDDNIFGLGGNDTLNGGDGVDTLRGGDGDDILNGDAGNDNFFGGAGADMFNGGEGADRVFYNDAAAGIIANFINPTLNTGEAAGDTYNSIESITGSNFDDVITSGNDDNDLVGLGGDDVLIGARGRDRLFGGAGEDRLLGGSGNDDLFGGAGADEFVIQSGAGSDRIFDYEVGVDVIQYIAGPGDISDLTIEQVGANTRITSIVGVLTLFGTTAADLTTADFTFLNPLADPTGVTVTTDLTTGNDNFVGDENDDVVNGLAGNDTINGGIGDDTLNGGDGNDFLTGGLGADIINGGAGTDRVLYSAASTGVTINLLNTALNTGEAAGDVYISIESYSLSNDADNFVGDNDGNTILGLGGRDVLSGLGGNDIIFGGSDDDRMTGGEGNDTLIGGAGEDTFVFAANSGNDTITDFEDGLDTLEFRGTVDSFAQLVITQDGANTVITSDNGVLTLNNFDSTLLDAADFTFI